MKTSLVVNKQYGNLSIKDFLKEYHVGKGKIEELRIKKSVYLNSSVVSLETKIKENDILSFDVDEKLNFIPSKQSVEVVYEDEQILIVNKPSGILIHPDGNIDNDTLVNRVAKYYKDKKLEIEVRYAHRIDVETSGLVIFCKDFLTHAMINYQIENHLVVREYRALVEGNILKKEGILNFPIGRDRHISNKFRVSDSLKAKEAITNYKVIRNLNQICLISCILKTGRTHQIRVHLSHINHPLLGDSLYGGSKNKIDRVALHSYRVKLINPLTQKEIDVKKDIPSDMEKVVNGK